MCAVKTSWGQTVIPACSRNSPQPRKISGTTRIERSRVAFAPPNTLWKASLSRWPTNRRQYRLQETNSRPFVPSREVLDRSKTLEFKSTELLKNCLHKIHSSSALSSEAPLKEGLIASRPAGLEPTTHGLKIRWP